MPIVTGTGNYMYEHHPNWAKLPRGQDWQGPSSIAVDSKDRVYVFQRGGPPILIFEKDGEFVGGWRRKPGQLDDAHHIYISPDDFVYLADRDAHQVLKFTTDGELVMALGTRHHASLQAPFNHPSDSCVGPNGDIFVSDGYANSSVHRFSPDGKHIASFGSPGSGPGEFRVPHSVRVSSDGRVYVADRGEQPCPGVHLRGTVPQRVDGHEVAHGSADHPGQRRHRHRPGAPLQRLLPGWRAAGPRAHLRAVP